MKIRLVLALPALLLISHQALAAVVDDMLKDFTAQGAGPFSADAGRTFWDSPHKDAATGQIRRCSSCHSDDLTQKGKHIITEKVIDPLAPSANPSRLTDREKIQKWLTRNCKFTLGRECTPQEKGDVLTMIRSR
jgi:hypothetical protein